MAPLRRLPYPRKSPLTFPIVLLAAILFLLGIILLASIASAAPAPAGGPRLGGGAAPDGTLLGAFFFDTDGEARWLSEVDTLRTDTIWFLAYAPMTRTETGQLDLTFRWETGREVTTTTTVDGQLQTSTETVWNTTDERTFQIGAPYRSVDFTEIELPKKEGERLTLEYEVNGRPFRVAQLTHHTSPVFAKLPRQVVQDQYVMTAKLLALALASAAAGIGGAAYLHKKRAGGYTPALGPLAWVLTPVGLAIVGYMLWSKNREGLVLEGTWPLFTLLALGAGMLSLQFWRDEPRTDLIIRIHDEVNASEPRFTRWRRYIPLGTDPRPLSTAANHQQYVDDTWGSWMWRVLFGARTYLQFPETHRWHYTDTRDGGRLYILEGGKEMKTVQRPGIIWFPNGLGLPLFRIERMGLVDVPLSPWAQNEKVVMVLAKLRNQQLMAHEHQALLEENADLKGELKSGVITGARRVVDKFLMALDAVRSGKEYHAAVSLREAAESTEAPSTTPEHGGEAGAPTNAPPSTPTAAPPAPAPRPTP